MRRLLEGVDADSVRGTGKTSAAASPPPLAGEGQGGGKHQDSCRPPPPQPSPARGIPVVLGGPHVTLLPEEAMRHADAVCVGYAEETWPQLVRDFAAGRMRRRYDQGHDFELTNLPFARRDLLDGRHFLTQAVF